jgi:hypothetical protein
LYFSIQIAMLFVCGTIAIVVLTNVQHMGLIDPNDQDSLMPVVMGAAVTVPRIGLIVPRAVSLMKRQRGWKQGRDGFVLPHVDVVHVCTSCFDSL